MIKKKTASKKKPKLVRINECPDCGELEGYLGESTLYLGSDGGIEVEHLVMQLGGSVEKTHKPCAGCFTPCNCGCDHCCQ